MILITAKTVVAPEDREAFREIAELQVKNSRAEEGCLDYGYYEDAMAPDTFIFVEKWRDQAALDFHFAQEYSQAFAKSARAMMKAGSPIEMHYVSEVKVIGKGR